MHKTRVAGVQFNGSQQELHDLIGRWNALRGVRWKVAATDYVGGSFDVTFMRDTTPVEKAEAERWVASALAHAPG